MIDLDFSASHVARADRAGTRRKTKRRRRRDCAGTRGGEGVGDAPAQASVVLRHHIFQAGDVHVGQGEVRVLEICLRNRGDERVSGARRFGGFQKE